MDIQPSLITLRNGGIILYPTDTIWGIGCDATNMKAVSLIYEIKKRDDSRSLLVLVSDIDMLKSYVQELPAVALQLMRDATKPLSIIYPEAKNLPRNLVADNGSIGIRIAKDPYCQLLIQTFGKPLVSTSANISGEQPPQFFDEISDEIKSAVDYIAEWRRDDHQPASPSSIVKLEKDGSYRVIRQ